MISTVTFLARDLHQMAVRLPTVHRGACEASSERSEVFSIPNQRNERGPQPLCYLIDRDRHVQIQAPRATGVGLIHVPNYVSINPRSLIRSSHCTNALAVGQKSSGLSTEVANRTPSWTPPATSIGAAKH